MARDLLQELQAAEEMKSGEDARSISYHPIKPGTPRAGARKGGNPYTRPCTNPRYCRRPPGRPPHNPLKRGAAHPGAPRGKTYTRPCPYGKACRGTPGPGS
ncbi:hypothetical protein ACLOJK_033004 [Asimina triloba]